MSNRASFPAFFCVRIPITFYKFRLLTCIFCMILMTSDKFTGTCSCNFQLCCGFVDATATHGKCIKRRIIRCPTSASGSKKSSKVQVDFVSLIFRYRNPPKSSNLHVHRQDKKNVILYVLLILMMRR